MNKIVPDKNCVKMAGRAFIREGKIWLGYSGSGIDFISNCEKVSINIIGDSTSENPDKVNDRCKLAVYVDGERKLATLVDEKCKQLTVEMEKGQHLISLIKITESAMSFCIIDSIETDGESISPAPDKKLLIEFAGDSITCGYGVDETDPEVHFITDTEDVTKSYSYQTALNLDADYSMASLSGYGIISGFTDNPDNGRPDQLLTDHYEQAGYSFADIDGKRPQDVDWDFDNSFNGRKPDVVVINLGTNDDSFCADNNKKQLHYKDRYKIFLKKVRKLNPDAHIFGILGMMGQRLCPYVELAVNEYSKETGDNKVYAVTMDEQNRDIDGIAADYHPSPATHKKAADFLAGKIREVVCQ